MRTCRLPDRAEPVDLAIAGGRIREVGAASGPARETIDVAGSAETAAEAVGRLIFVLGALTMLAALVLLGLDARRCRNVPASSAEPV